MRGKLLTDERAIARVMAEHRTLGQRIREILRRIGEDLRKIFGKSEPTLERAQALWDRAYEQATRNAENGQKNTAREGGEKTRYSTKNEVLAMPNIDWMEDDSSIKKQLRKHSDKISKTEPVAVVQYVHDKSESLVKIIMDQLPRIGGSFIKNKGVSFVFDKEGVNKIDAHATGPELRAAAMAAPYVAKYGELIAGQKNHEKTGITTLTFAAPVIINGDIVNVGVVIQFQAEGRPRAVNVDYNGNRFRINNEASRGTGSRVDHYSQGTSLPTRDASKTSIPNFAEKVRGKFSLAQTQKVFPRTKGRSFRGYSSKSALSRAGYAMFTDDFDQAYDYTSSGRALWTVDNTKLQDVQELIPTIEKALLQGYENGTLPAEMDYLDEDGLRKLAGEADPENIVMSAGLWDNEAALTYLFDAGVFDDVPGVKTRDGAVVFDETLIEKDNPDWYTEDSETRNAGRYDLTDEEARKATEWEQAQMDKAREVLDDPESTESDRMVAELVMQRTEERIGERTQRESRNAKEALAILCVCAYNKNRLQETRCFYALSLLRLSRKQGH